MALNIERKYSETQFSRVLDQRYLMKYRKKFLFRREIDIFFDQFDADKINMNTKKKKKEK